MEPLLKNTQQLTFPSMGFEKAGESYFSPDGQTIIFQAVPTGQKHYQIYTLKMGTQIPKMVSTGQGACTCPFFRPDGQKIIFASSHEDPNLNTIPQVIPGYNKDNSKYSWEFTPYMNIYEANPDGSDLKALTTGSAYKAECAYSNTGDKIVYASNQHGRMNLYQMNANGSNSIQLTFETHVYVGGPFFSPDDTQIIYRADYDQPHYLQIYSINANDQSRIRRQLTDNSAVNWAPFWHPNGQIIAYTTSIHGHTNYEIYLMNIRSGHHLRLTYHPAFDGLPSFDRTGTQMVWTSKRGDDQTCQIFIADIQIPDEFIYEHREQNLIA